VTARIASRARIARKQAAALHLRMVQRGGVFELRNAGDTVLVGSIAAVENYLGEQYEPNRPGRALGHRAARVAAADHRGRASAASGDFISCCQIGHSFFAQEPLA
jgi:hypothetical protein